MHVFQSIENLKELILVQDFNRSEEWKKVSLKTSIVVQGPQKQLSFLVSTEKLVLLSFDREDDNIVDCAIICLKTGKELCKGTYAEPGEASIPLGMVDGYLLFEEYGLNIKSGNFEMIRYKNDMDLDSCSVVSCGPSFYISMETLLASRSIDAEGQLQQSWVIGKLRIDQIPVRIHETACNHKYLVAHCKADFFSLPPGEKSFRGFYILGTEGTLIGTIRLSASYNEYNLGHTRMCLVDDVLVYIDTEDKKLTFWHIPSNTCLNKFGFKDSIIDVKSTEDKLIVLTSRPRQGKEGNEYQVIQFDIGPLFTQGHILDGKNN